MDADFRVVDPEDAFPGVKPKPTTALANTLSAVEPIKAVGHEQAQIFGSLDVHPVFNFFPFVKLSAKELTFTIRPS